MKKVVLCCLLCAGLLVFFSCENTTSTGKSNSIPIETVEFEEDNGWILAKTNDSARYDYSYWHWYDSSEEAEMTEVIVNCKKISGASTYGYGLIFCYIDDDNFYRMLITKNGYYQIMARTSGAYTFPKSWTFSANINTGYDIENQLKIQYDPTSHNFSFYCNDNLLTTINRDSFAGNRSSGKAGFHVSIGSASEENFPEVPVEIKYQMLSPVIIP